MMALSQIEENIYELSLNEQLWLIERLAQHIRKATVVTDNFETQFFLFPNSVWEQENLIFNF